MDADQQVESSVQQLAELHDAHHRDATAAQRFANRITQALGRPGALMIVIVLVIVWMIGNYAAARAGVTALEEPPFPELGLLVTVFALMVALLILTTQRHEQLLAEKRSQLTLQVAILSERKIGKLIGMVDELRRARRCPPRRIPKPTRWLPRPTRSRRWNASRRKGSPDRPSGGRGKLPRVNSEAAQAPMRSPS